MSKKGFAESDWRKEPRFRALCRAFLKCKTESEIANFLRDIATLSELWALSERLQVARLLDSGMTYRAISEITGASTTTVTRVANFLQNGEGGYRNILKRKHHTSSLKAQKMC